MLPNESRSVEQSPYYWNSEPVTEIKKRKELKNKFNMVDLFCGAGGISCGFHMTGKFRTIMANDIYVPAVNTFKLNNPHASTILGDVRKITEKQYKELIGTDKVHIVTAGVPCQGFSLSNKKRHHDDERNFLFLEVIRFVDIFEPDIIMIENVSGMKSLSSGVFVKDIKCALENAGSVGYQVLEPQLLNAADFGVPQIRKRLIFLAVKNGLPSIKYPSPTHGFNLAPYKTIKDAISDLPPLENNEEKLSYLNNPLSEYQRVLRGKQEVLLNHKSPKHPQSTIDMISKTEPASPMYEKYKQRVRLSWDIQSPTQVAGGIRPQFQFGHPDQNRGLSIRERARIQSFPDCYEFVGGIVQGRVQTGNAVPPLLAKAIAQEVFEVLHKHYKKED